LETVFITGFMAAGKSVVGAAVARRLGWKFVDLDGWIEERTGRSIPDLFAEGEDHFRVEERAALDDLPPCGGCVVALGGGALAWRDNLEVVQNSGLLTYLEVDTETLIERLEGSDVDRPLIEGRRGDDLRQHIGGLLDTRRHYYEAAAITVRGGREKSIETIAEELCHAINSRLSADSD
jgi:shikimate kinase